MERALAEAIRDGVGDGRVSPMTSVVSAVVAPDLKTCKVYISVLGDADEQRGTLEGLRAATGYLRRELARTVNLRITPELQFVLTQSIEYGVHMSRRIDEVLSEDRAQAALMQGPEGEGDESDGLPVQPESLEQRDF